MPQRFQKACGIFRIEGLAMDVEIVEYQDSDFDGFYRLLVEVIKEGKYLALLEPPSEDDALAFVRNHHEAGSIQLFAKHEQEIIGWIDLIPKGGPYAKHIASLGMGVQRDWRGKGLGKQLLTAILDAAPKRAFERIELEVYPENKRAIQLYETLGFQYEGYQKQAVQFGDIRRDLILMAKLLNQDATTPKAE
jgi:ribosomal protein S18 acetylase RimI-like enzyme